MGRADTALSAPALDEGGTPANAWLGPLLLLVTGFGMLAWTWRAWPDPLVDFGRELYVPWRLSSGEALFTDIAWFNGPLSQHWNALLFRIFGPGLSVLVCSNVLILAATVWMTYALVVQAAGRVAATTAGMVFLLVFAFGQYVGVGNYNWITPYSHEVTHGIALGLGAVAALDRWGRTGSAPAVALGGLALGLCFLTKVESFLAAAAGCAVLLTPALRRRDVRSLSLFVALGLAPVALSALLVGTRGTVGAWPSVLAGEVGRLPFYIAGMGFDDPGLRFAEVLAWSAMWLVVLAPPLALSWLARGTRGRWLALVAGLVMLAAMASIGGYYAWHEAVRPLALLMLLAMAGACVARSRGRRTHRNLLVLALTTFSFVLLFKMILNVRVSHYGFALAVPAMLVAVTVLVGWVPARLAARGARGDVFVACALAVIAVFAGRHVQTASTWLARKTEIVGTGRDAFRADIRGALVNRAVTHVRESGARSLGVLPEGVMINYLARTPASTPYVTFMPPEEILFGDEAWAEAFGASPPDLVLLVPREAWEYGRAPFGIGFGRSLGARIEDEYVPAGVISVEGIGLEIQSLTPRS